MWWFTSIILTILKAEIRRIAVPRWPGQKVPETSSQPVKARHGGTLLSFQLCWES
jgi:hypothetical protein